MKELIVLLQAHSIYLSINQLIALYQSITSEKDCLLNTNIKKQLIISKFYNKKWLTKNISITNQRIKNWSTKNNINIITFEDFDYPKSLFKLNNPPPCLYQLGALNLNCNNLAIVGRREAKSYTLKWMEDHLSEVLKDNKLNIISGGARGIDSKAHELALLNNQTTTYVIPSGLLNLYPTSLNSKAKSLVNSGASFISTYFPDQPMRKQNFSDRNLVIAALSPKILILEAEIRSGTYMTARYGADLGADLAVVPSFPSDNSFSGSLQLIYDGAQILRDKEDLKIFINS